MKLKFKTLSLIICLFFSYFSSLSFAGNTPGAFTLTLADAYYGFSPKRHIRHTSLPNAALAYNFNERWAIEADVGFLNTKQTGTGGAGVRGGLYMIDGLYRFLPWYCFEPYIFAGIGVISLIPNGNNPEQSGNINAGFGTQYFIDKKIALRTDVRDVYTFAGGVQDIMWNFGVSFLFG